ncbi:asparaginase [Saccharopolyspora erythraea]|uniref:asparaginase n=1 Tax=Saccharopolyspora erythraea TaxID=1836 RepID=UPI001BABFB81|nr:asparaginase [Saccharopolyspora erythraea]QUH05438.1 asparaginase [Saccharopolyspora erythraea]
MNRPVPLVEVVRDGMREGLHHGSVVVLGSDGSVLRAVGDVDSPMYPRSSNKPAQVVGMLRAGLELPDDADVALAAASHNGEPDHVRRAREVLRRHGLAEDALGCPPDWPLLDSARDELIASGHGKRPITMNCSGKHAAMLATCVLRGWSTEDYLDPRHPLQVALCETVADLCGGQVRVTAVDGCGAPLFAMPLTGLARMFRNLALSGDLGRRVADAMRGHPWLVAGTGRLDTELMRAVPGLLSKEGAEGVFAFALPDGCAVAVKIADGAARGRAPVAVGALRAFGVDGPALDALGEPPVLGGGRPVGAARLLPDVF